jgi:hypothetical protein
MHKTPYVFPIIGQRKVEHLKANINALSVELSEEEIDEIEGAAPFDIGFPMNIIFRNNYKSSNTAADVFGTQITAHIDAPPHQAIVRPRK